MTKLDKNLFIRADAGTKIGTGHVMRCFALAESFSKDSLKAQLECAHKLHAKFTLILGEKERTDGTIIIRNMEGGEQEVIDITKLIPILHRKLEIPKSIPVME